MLRPKRSIDITLLLCFAMDSVYNMEPKGPNFFKQKLSACFEKNKTKPQTTLGEAVYMFC